MNFICRGINLLLILLLFSLNSLAAADISVYTCSPLSISSGRYGSATFGGVGAGMKLAYLPGEPYFHSLYPSADVAVYATRIPVYLTGGYGLSVQATYKHFFVGLNYRLGDQNNFFNVYGGLGICVLQPDVNNVETSNPNINAQLVGQGNNHMLPGATAGIEYRKHFKNNTHFFWGIGAGVETCNLFSPGKYYVHSGGSYYDATLPNWITTPSLKVSLNYIIGKTWYDQ